MPEGESRWPSPHPGSGLVESNWLMPSQATVTHQAATIFPDDAEVFLPLRGWSRSDWIDRTLLRLESLGDLPMAHSPTTSSLWSSLRLRTGYAVAAEKLARVDDALGEYNGERRERWNSIVERVDSLPAVDATSPEIEGPSEASLEEILVNHPAALYGMIPSNADRIWSWRFDDYGRRAVRAGLVFLAAVLAFRLIARSQWRTRLRRHPHMATALLGLLWWLCLTPSLFGLAMLAWSAWAALSSGQRSAAATASIGG
jgi:hypothetical protein